MSWAESFKPKGISALLAGTGAFYNTACGGVTQPNCTDPITDFRFDQEKLDNYELGAKTSWLDGALRLNGAVFFQDFKNKQVSTQVDGPEHGPFEPAHPQRRRPRRSLVPNWKRPGSPPRT